MLCRWAVALVARAVPLRWLLARLRLSRVLVAACSCLVARLRLAATLFLSLALVRLALAATWLFAWARVLAVLRVVPCSLVRAARAALACQAAMSVCLLARLRVLVLLVVRWQCTVARLPRLLEARCVFPLARARASRADRSIWARPLAALLARVAR